MIGAINRFNVALLQSTIENNKTLVITYSKINLACSMLFPDTIIHNFHYLYIFYAEIQAEWNFN